MHSQGTINFDNAIGGYVVRIFNHVTNADNTAQLASVRKGLEEAKGYRIANERTLGRTVDEAALDAEIEANIAEMSTKLSGRGLETFAARYSQQGTSYRIEQFSLSNKVDLGGLRDALKDGKIPFKPSYSRTWNGKQFASIVGAGGDPTLEQSNLQKSRKPTASGPFAALSYEDRGALPKFTTYARDSAADPTLLKKMADQGFPATTEVSQTKEGDDAIVLRVGTPGSVSMYLEVTVLPTKGYCVYSASMKVGGAVLSHDEFRDFVQTSAGFWLPLRIVREAYKLDERQVPYLFSKEEVVAFEPPKTNVALADTVFDLASSSEFKALPFSTHLLPQGSPLIKVSDAVASDRLYRLVFLIGNVIVIAAIVGFWFRRKLARRGLLNS